MQEPKNSTARRGFINRILSVFAIGGLATQASANSSNSGRRMSRSNAMGLDPFIGEIALFPYTFAPQGWANCDGQLLPISQNEALFSLIGTIYGGDGSTTFALPDLRSRVPLHVGNGPGLPNYNIGQKGGNSENYLATQNLPSHTHAAVVGGDVKLKVSSDDVNSDEIVDGFLGTTGTQIYSSSATPGEFAGDLENNITVTNGATGNNFPVNNMQPYLTLRYCIALQGIYPSIS